MFILSIFIAGLCVVAVVHSLPQLTDTLDQTLVPNSDTRIASNSDSDQNVIANFDFQPNLPNLSGSLADLGDLTKSTQNYQMSSTQPNSPAVLFSYNPPSSDISSDSNAPSNSDVSSSSAIQPDSEGTSESKDSYDLTFLSPEDKQTDTNGEDQKIAQELFVPKAVDPEIGIPRGVLPNGADVTPPVPDPSNQDSDWDWIDVKPYTVTDPEEYKNPPDCTKLKGNNERMAMCCGEGAPMSSGQNPGSFKLNPRKTTRRGNCILCMLRAFQ